LFNFSSRMNNSFAKTSNMKRLFFLLTTAAALVCYRSQAQDPGMELQAMRNRDSGILRGGTGEELRSAVFQSNRLYGQAFVKGDSLLFVNRYDRNAWIMPPNSPALMGPDAPSSFFAIAYHQMNIRNVLLSTNELYDQGDYATEVGSFELRDVANKVLNRGKYVVVWKRTDGKWKMYRDCFNSDSK
jgi:ketosteroid isomerase-like protein